jgi:hypothetical protein
MPAPLATPAVANPLVFAGNCRVTVVGDRSRYTFRVSAAKPNPNYPNAAPTYFVGLLTGPDNTSDYQYIGATARGAEFRLTRASRLPADSPPVLAASFLFRALATGNERAWSRVQVWHEDTCARCGRDLTDPASIATRLGPDCYEHVHGTARPVLVTEAAVVADADAVEAAEAAPVADEDVTDPPTQADVPVPVTVIPASRPTARTRRAAPAAPAPLPVFRDSLPTGDDIAY